MLILSVENNLYSVSIFFASSNVYRTSANVPLYSNGIYHISLNVCEPVKICRKTLARVLF